MSGKVLCEEREQVTSVRKRKAGMSGYNFEHVKGTYESASQHERLLLPGTAVPTCGVTGRIQ